jgi:hypothetical protein
VPVRFRPRAPYKDKGFTDSESVSPFSLWYSPDGLTIYSVCFTRNGSCGVCLTRELPANLRHLSIAFAAIGFLHRNGFRHGDIRNDHIIVDRHSDRYVPLMLNNILMHFSVGAPIAYESVDEIMEDLDGYLASL